MGTTFRKFFIQLTLFSIVSLAIQLIWQHFASVHFQTNLYWVILLFFILTTAFIHVLLVKVSEKDPRKFVTYFMGMTGIKLFAYLIIILAYGLSNRETAQGFIICFLITYFLYSGFEVVTLMRHFKK
jgi:bacteriorhodopsin